MAASPLVPKNGSVSISPWGSAGMNFNSYDLDAKQDISNISAYGSGKYSANVGSGTPDLDFTINSFALSHATNTPLAIGDISTTAVNFAAASAGTGVATVFTADTGCTESLSSVIGSVKVSHGRMKGAVAVTITGKNAGDVTEVYATT